MEEAARPQPRVAARPQEGSPAAVPSPDDALQAAPGRPASPPASVGPAATSSAEYVQMDINPMPSEVGQDPAVAERLAQARHWLHELRNPLTAVIGGLAVALKPPPGLDETRREALLAGALASARLADAWVQDLGDWCRVLGGEALPAGQAVPLGEVVQGAMAALAPVAQAKGVAVAWAPPAEPVLVHGEAERFGRVAMALLHRAIRGAKGPVVLEAMPKGVGLVVRPGVAAGDPQLGHAQAVAAAYGGALSWTEGAFEWRMAPPSA